MDVSKGFQIERPNIFVAWGITEAELVEALRETDLRRITDGYFVIDCVSLGGLSHKLGFHFNPRVAGRLNELEFFGTNSPDNASSFQAFQEHLEATFGQATTTVPGEEGFFSYTWLFDGGYVLHCVQERFGPAEYVRIRRGKPHSLSLP